MTFFQAKDCFADALRYLTPDQDPVQWNLASGLHALTQALESEFGKIQNLLNQIEFQQRSSK